MNLQPKCVRALFAVLSILLVFVGIDGAPTTATRLAGLGKGSIVFVPLDERYATRGLWLNLVRLAKSQYDVQTPPLELISRRKQPANFENLKSWVVDALSRSSTSEKPAFIFSFEQLIYGGLIASRTGNETLSTIAGRVKWLVDLKLKYKNVKFYCSTTVMRIPSYNGDFEEPWYWQSYGRDLYEYSFYSSRYSSLKNDSDLVLANHYKSLIPDNVLKQFLWRRHRNFNVTYSLFQYQKAYNSLFDSLYLTLDDTGTYGFNVNEASKLKELKTQLKLNPDAVRIYPGADEVESCLLSKMVVQNLLEKKPSVQIKWRLPNAINLIPNYEDQPIGMTVKDQIQACGGNVVVDQDPGLQPDVIFAVNNFANAPQLEASQQSERPVSDYSKAFDNLTKQCRNRDTQKMNSYNAPILALADVRYSNGGDMSFVDWIKTLIGASDRPCLTPGLFAYAAWNTDGNTLGTVAANAILLSTLAKVSYGNSAFNNLILQNKRFTLLRILEDTYYQGIGVRDELINYIGKTSDSINNLSTDLEFYEHYSYKPLLDVSSTLANILNIEFQPNAPSASGIPLKSIYYPWNRTFEIGFVLYNMSQNTEQIHGGPIENERQLYNLREKQQESVKQLPQKQRGGSTISCDIIIAGGSTAALAAALSAADEDPNLDVCLIEPTSWAGGQLTSSLVTAIDFGKKNRKISCLPKLFASYLAEEGYPRVNPGKCWVSTFCYEARQIMQKFIEPQIMKRKNLLVFYQTVVSNVDVSGNKIMKVNAIARKPVSEMHLKMQYSEQVEDWYSTEDSSLFQKSKLQFSRSKSDSPPVVIDATENGDILVVSGAPFVQGNEFSESGTKSDDTCGQSIAYTMYLAKEQTIDDSKFQSTNVLAANFSLGKFKWSQVWSYRQVSSNTSLMAWGSQDGHGNDYPYGYHHLPVEDAVSQKPWKGGLNLTTLKLAEEYALEFAKWYISKEPGFHPQKIAHVNSYESIGTLTGLSQVPYIRDTRRSIGVDGFRLNSTHLSEPAHFNDRVALGDYIYFDAHRMHDCKPLKYDGVLKPYFIPLRALTNMKYANLIVVGKTMSQTNAANAATRLHPVEFSSGTAGGIFASYMIKNNLESTGDVCENCSNDEYCELQNLIQKYQPIEWDKCLEM